MNLALRMLVLIAIASSLFGCRTEMVDAEAIRPLIKNVVERHDSYVVTDHGLTLEEKEIYLQSSALLLQVLDEASPPSSDATNPGG